MRRGLALLVALLSIPTAAARGGMPDALTPRGDMIESIYFQIFVAGTVVFLIVMFLLVFVMWRYRAHGGAGRATFEMEREHLGLELAWIGIPLVVVLWVGVISYSGLIDLDEGVDAQEAWMEIGVTGFQWTWLADYGSNITLFSDPDPLGNVPDANVFKVPAGVPIRYNVTGGDVIHAWHIMDANWATVGLIDANPFGPHKYNHLTMSLPEGEYQVQCREMCFNPGHGYMRARVQAVPMQEFEDWLAGQRLAADAKIPQAAALSLRGGAIEGAEDLLFVTGDGARAIVTFENTGDDEVRLGIPGMSLLTSRFEREDGRAQVLVDEQQNVTVPAGATRQFAFDLQETGRFTLHADGASAGFRVIEAEAVQVDLGDFFISPSRIELEAGTTYLFQVTNIGGAPHNIFIGDGPDGDALWQSATINPGVSTSFTMTPAEPVTLETWCNVAGHYGLGMRGTAVITEG